MKIRCRFIRKKYENKENGWCAAIYRAQESVENAAKGEQFTATGVYLPLEDKPGEVIVLDGDWKDGKHGMQFSVFRCHSEILPTRNGTVAYLTANVKGMGKVTAGKLYDAYGDNLFAVVEQEPKRLQADLRPEVYENLLDTYRRTKTERDLILLLEPHGVPVGTARGLIKKLGANALDTVRQEPYSLCDLRGVGFLAADEVARAVGYDLASERRIEEGLLYMLKDNQSRGHLFIRRARLAEMTEDLLQNSERSLELSDARIDGVLESMVSRGEVLRQRTEKAGDLIYLRKAFIAERDTAKAVLRLLWQKPAKPIDHLDELIQKAEKKLGITYSEQQRQAIKTTFQHNFHIITGYPGTGKTTVLRGILYVQNALKQNAGITLCSPTGRAARRMTEATGHGAQTIHSLLGLRGDEMPEETPELEKSDMLIVDEVSMVDMYLMHLLLDAVPSGTRVVLVGDPDQLPAVGPGAVLVELIRSCCVPVTNPCSGVKIVKRSDVEDTEGKLVALSNAQKNKLITAVSGGRGELFVAIGLWCGLRREETLGQNWADVDWAEQTLTIRRTVTFPDNKPIVSEKLKSKSSRRTVPIPPPLMELLEKKNPTHAATTQIVKRHKHAPDEIILTPYICSDAWGKPMSKSAYRKFWASVENAVDFRVVSHMLRHTYCVWLHDNGIDLKTAQYLMGHSDIRMTANIYTQIGEDQVKNASKKILEIFNCSQIVVKSGNEQK